MKVETLTPENPNPLYQESKISIDKYESEIIIDPKNYQWHFNNPQIVGEYNFIDDHRKFNKVIPKRSKEIIYTMNNDLVNDSVTEIQEPNLIGVLSPNDRIELEDNDLDVNMIWNSESDLEVKESKVNRFPIEDGNDDGKFYELGDNPKSKDESKNAIRKKNSIEEKEKVDLDYKLIKSESNEINKIEKIIPLPNSKKNMEENELYKNELNNAIVNYNAPKSNTNDSNENSNLDAVNSNNPLPNKANSDIKNGSKVNANKKKNGCCSIF